MNETQARIAYVDWCTNAGKRLTPASWELWKAAYEQGWRDKLPAYDSLREREKRFAEGVIESLSEGMFR